MKIEITLCSCVYMYIMYTHTYKYTCVHQDHRMAVAGGGEEEALEKRKRRLRRVWVVVEVVEKLRWSVALEFTRGAVLEYCAWRGWQKKLREAELEAGRFLEAAELARGGEEEPKTLGWVATGKVKNEGGDWVFNSTG